MSSGSERLLWAFWAYLLLICRVTTAFNLAVSPRTVAVLETPASSAGEQYFGYSVALHSDGSKKWVIVGAPLANVSSNMLNYGTAYKCNPLTGKCDEIIVDHDAVMRASTYLNSKETIVDLEIKKGQWLGAVIHSTGESDGIREKAVICAPRYIWRGFPPYADSDLQFLWPLGKCFLLDGTLTSVKETMEPCKTMSKGNNYYGYCQAGTSAAYPDSDTVLMGTVGVSQWRGGVASYSHSFDETVFSVQDQLERGDYMGYAVVGGHFSNPSNLELIGGAPRAENLKGKVLMYSLAANPLSVTAPLPPPDNIGIGSYFGSALCAVDLNDDRYTDVLVGAPRFTETLDEGRVFVYINNKKGALNPSDTVLKGDNKPGAQFGSAIAAVGDLNKDGYQDVAVGAPFEENGAGSGAVYIYHGTSEGVEATYRQKIVAASFGQGDLDLFGYSITGNVDVDDNQYSDVAIGAYASERAVVLRSRRIIDVTGEVLLSKARILLDRNVTCSDNQGNSRDCLDITLRFKYSDVTRPSDKDLRIEYVLELDRHVDVNLRRLYTVVDQSQETIVKGSHVFKAQNSFEEVSPIRVYIMDAARIADVVSELTFDLTYSLNKSSGCSNDGLCPVLNDYTKNSARAVAFFQKKCKADKCILDLELKGKVVYERGDKELRVGYANSMTVKLTIENLEEDTAYDAKVILTYPSFLGYVGVRSDERIICSKSVGENETSVLTCAVGTPANPLSGNSKRELGVVFSAKNAQSDFSIAIETTSGVVQDINEDNNKQELDVKVKFEADLEMKGSSNPDQVVYSEEEVNDPKKMLQKDIGPKVVQTLQIRNNGPTVVDGSEVFIHIPSLYDRTTKEDYLLYLLKVELTGPGTCNVTVNPRNILETQSTGNETTEETDNKRRKRRDAEPEKLDCRSNWCTDFKCSLGKLLVGSTVEIGITARLWQSTLVRRKVGVVDLETEARVEIPAKFSQSKKDNDRVTITLRANPAKSDVEGKSTPWYVILAAVLGGVLLLAIAAAVLYKFGFFRRKRYGKDISDPQTDELEPMNQ